MALTFPRDMPCPITGEVVFKQRFMQARALPGGGSPQVVGVGPTLWVAKWTVTAKRDGTAEAWTAWAASLRGGLKTFKGRPKRRWPLSKPKGFAGTGFGGSGVLNAIGAARDTVTVTGLLAGLVLAPGDHFSLPVGSRQHLHRITEGGTVSGLGAVTLSCEPPLHVNAAVNAAVLIDGPWCDMVLSAPPDESMALGMGIVSFEGLQVIA